MYACHIHTKQIEIEKETKIIKIDVLDKKIKKWHARCLLFLSYISRRGIQTNAPKTKTRCWQWKSCETMLWQTDWKEYHWKQYRDGFTRSRPGFRRRLPGTVLPAKWNEMADDQGRGTITGHALPDYLVAFFPRRFIPENRRRISHQQKYRPRLRQTQPRVDETLSDRRKNGHLIAPNR